MTVSVDVLRLAMELPSSERAQLATELLASLDAPADPDAEQAWAVEIERRAQRSLAGESRSRSWSDLRDRLLRKELP